MLTCGAGGLFPPSLSAVSVQHTIGRPGGLVGIPVNLLSLRSWVDEGESAEPTRDKKYHRHVPQEGVQFPSPIQLPPPM